MHNNYFTGHIYVEKTSEQCHINYRNSQSTREGGWWDKHSSGDSDNQQVEGKDDTKEDI